MKSKFYRLGKKYTDEQISKTTAVVSQGMEDTAWGSYGLNIDLEKLKKYLPEEIDTDLAWKPLTAVYYNTFYPMDLMAWPRLKDESKTSVPKERLIKQMDLTGEGMKDVVMNRTHGILSTDIKKNTDGTPKQGPIQICMYLPLKIQGSGPCKFFILHQKSLSTKMRVHTDYAPTSTKYRLWNNNNPTYNEKLVKECNHITKTYLKKLSIADSANIEEGVPIIFSGDDLHVENNWVKSSGVTGMSVLKVLFQKASIPDMQYKMRYTKLNAHVPSE